MSDINETSAVPGMDNSKHDEIAVKIIDVKDANGSSIKDKDFDTRKFAETAGKKCSIEFEIKNQEGTVGISIEVQSPDFAKKYYKKTLINSISTSDDPIIANCYFDSYAPGKHKFEWDGRGLGDGERLLIEGQYKIVIKALCSRCLATAKDECTFTVKKAYAHCYSAKYPKKDYEGPPWDLSKRADIMRKQLKSLSDGSHFETGGSKTDTAHDAMAAIKDLSSVCYWNGHAAPGIIDFYDADLHNTCIVSAASVGTTFGMDDDDLEIVDDLDDHSLDNVFLIILLGCTSAGTPSGASSLPDALTAKGVDIVIGFKSEVYSLPQPKWTKDLYQSLNSGKGILDSVIMAKSGVIGKDNRKSFGFKISIGGKAKANDKLIPARYGTKKI
jgi:hypothetical protein